MKIKILRDTRCNGKPVKKGDIVDASSKDARLLINIKKAVKHEEKEPAKKQAKKAVSK